MAVAAEVLKQQTGEFDWDLAEVQFSETADYERPPEAEIYGRSLSTIYSLGNIAKKLAEKAARSPEADQVRVEFYTSVEEGFGTDAELGGVMEVRDFDTRPVMNGKAMSKDLKKAVSDMTWAGVLCAEKRAEWDMQFSPQLTRTKWDHRNALIVDKMVRGETRYNTRIVISPFPEEAAERSGDKYWGSIGYVPHLRRGFLQIYHATEEGLISGSLSFDGSNKERLREVFGRYGVQIPEGEVTDNWLQYAITDNLSTEQAKALATEIADQAGDTVYEKTANTVDITTEHRVIMDKVFNESYIPACESLARGYQTEDARKLIFQLADNAGSFNERYQKALYRMRADGSKFTDDDMVVLHELLVYSTIEMMRALFIKEREKSQSYSDRGHYSFRQADAVYLQSLETQAFQHMLGGFGGDGARSGRAVFACGLSIAPGEGSFNGDPQKAYGGADSKQEWYGRFKTTGTCVNCHEGPKEVGEKSWCHDCIKGHCGTK